MAGVASILSPAMNGTEEFVHVRNDWSLAEVHGLFALPFLDLLFTAQQVHRQFQAPNTVQISTLLSIVEAGASTTDITRAMR
jgi:biotin synthase-like enzyme